MAAGAVLRTNAMRLIAALACATGAVAAAPAAEPLRLATGNSEPFATAQRSGFLDRIVAEAFGRAGSRAQLVTHESSERALVNANQGVDDGLAARIRGIEAQYPNLVVVPEKVFDNDFVAYAMRADIGSVDWSTLRRMHVAYIRGWRIFESSLGNAREVTRAHDARQLFDLLREGRADVALYERWQGLWHARELGLPIRMLQPPLARQEMFLYLHKRHAALAPKVAAALADMKRDGAYQRIFDATLAPLDPPGPAR
jgi:polar amino acid transport system substrate-binding protein